VTFLGSEFPSHSSQFANQRLHRRYAAWIRTVLIELFAWLTARPRPRNRIDETNATRFFETGSNLVGELVGAIACGQHVAVAGPRGCGKSHCIGQAIEEAEKAGLIQKDGWIKIQGNKELPRDYLLEDDMTLIVGDDAVVYPKRKSAPLFRFADRSLEEETLGRPVTDEKRNVVCYGVDKGGKINKSMKLEKGQRIVLFLDEVNRFSDGVLDSLLLLLEEGEVVMGGETFRLPVVVMMTMNPPGYDASARILSPPLSARIGRQYRLLSPRLDVLTDLIAAKASQLIVGDDNAPGLGSNEIAISPPSGKLIRRAAAVTLAAWGVPPNIGEEEQPGFDYLSDETKALLRDLAKLSGPLKRAMNRLNELCHFGPDGRALGDWMVAASVAAVNEARARNLGAAEAQAHHFVACTVTVLSHKLQDNFSSASRPDNTKKKEEALQTIATEIMLSSDEKLDKLLGRKIDNDEELETIAKALNLSLNTTSIRDELIKAGVTAESELGRWQNFVISIQPVIFEEKSQSDLEKVTRTELISVGLLERDGDKFAFSSPSALKVLSWLGDTIRKTTNYDRAGYAFQKICEEANVHPEPLEQVLSNFVFIREGIWKQVSIKPRLFRRKINTKASKLNNNSRDLATGLLRLLQEGQIDSLPRRHLTALFERLERVWIQAEHHGTSSEQQLWAFLSGTDNSQPLPSKFRPAAMQFAHKTLERMARHPARGRATRRARRIIAARIEEFAEETGAKSPVNDILKVGENSLGPGNKPKNRDSKTQT
jgi:MoxR-like ATPase